MTGLGTTFFARLAGEINGELPDSLASFDLSMGPSAQGAGPAESFYGSAYEIRRGGTVMNRVEFAVPNNLPASSSRPRMPRRGG